MRMLVAILLAGLIAVTAGCGGGKKSPSSTETLSGSTSVTLTATTPGGSGSAPNFASAKNCRDLAGLAAKVASAITASSGNPAVVLQTESKELQALAKAAPSDIRGDFQTFSTAFSSFLHALEEAGYNPGSNAAPTAAQIAALSKAARSFYTPKLRQAEQHLSAWARKNCKGIRVGG